MTFPPQRKAWDSADRSLAPSLPPLPRTYQVCTQTAPDLVRQCGERLESRKKHAMAVFRTSNDRHRIDTTKLMTVLLMEHMATSDGNS